MLEPPGTNDISVCERELMSDWNQNTIEEFRANDGKVGGMFEGANILLLHHTGARSGVERISPLMYQPLQGGFAVFASKGGADTNPDWYHNITANPETKVEVGTQIVAVSARVAEGEEHKEIWEQQKLDRPQFAGYEQKTSRDRIPVIILERI
jgi:deazaflavin-dependent oxidoreductase (nitroreductase family)